MLQEFKEFALRGNALDLAVGIIIGAAFTGIVNSLVEDIIMPPIGAILGGIDFSDYYWQLTMRDRSFASLKVARDAGAAVIAFGAFINAVIKFVIVAFAVFILVRQVNRLHALIDREGILKTTVPRPPDIVLLEEIRDLLKERPTPAQAGSPNTSARTEPPSDPLRPSRGES